MGLIDVDRRREYQREYYHRTKERNRERLNACSKRYYQNHKEKVLAKAALKYPSKQVKALYLGARNRARKDGVEFDLLPEDIVVPEYCSVFWWVKLAVGPAGGSIVSPSIDRIDPSKGYTKDNIQVISHKANRMKNNGTLEEIAALGDWAHSLLDSRT